MDLLSWDYGIRSVLDARLRSECAAGGGRIIHELGVARGAHRIDLAVITEATMTGHEIKSARDRLTRFPAQAQAFGAVFDRLTLTVDERHVVAAQATLPAWWGIEVVTAGEERRIASLRPAADNPGVQREALAELLWRPALQEALERRGLLRGLRSATGARLRRALVQALSLDELRAEVRRTVVAQRDAVQARR